MTLTIGQWFIAGVLAIITIFLGIYLYKDYAEGATVAVTFIIGAIITVGYVLFMNWYNTSTADGARTMKDYKSNLNNGLERTVEIYAEDGRQIYSYEGKIDIEDNPNYILFEDENGKRHIIYYGALDTVIIEEK